MSLLETVLSKADPRGFRTWGPGFLRSLQGEKPDPRGPVHLYFCVADHYEPRWRKPTLDEERRRVGRWVDEYPRLAQRHRDSFGRSHVRTLFFPEEEYRVEHLQALRELADGGYVDVEVHLHHDKDNAANLRRTLTDFARCLHESHGFLRKNAATGKIEYAFIHGNWALDNSLPGGAWCGVDNELSILVETGCYLDMTLPSVPSPAQSKMVNTIFYARGREGCSRGHDTGRPVRIGGAVEEGELLLIPGPLGLHLKSRAKGLVPRIEAAMLEPESPVPIEQRVEAWVRYAPAVEGAPNHRFIKLHAHGCNGTAPDYFLNAGGPFDAMLTELERRFSDTRSYLLHYVTAREMYDVVKGIEAGVVSNLPG